MISLQKELNIQDESAEYVQYRQALSVSEATSQ